MKINVNQKFVTFHDVTDINDPDVHEYLIDENMDEFESVHFAQMEDERIYFTKLKCGYFSCVIYNEQEYTKDLNQLKFWICERMGE